ncbi:DUF4232 domain-containing protein [Streptomyces gibsoniae]|uniref:DUF4232 domain-containing protein n=1 Tax=Streptomyces gibsoniae TaxID=3075529 RepID=A0ABU2U0K8_9ACTN|nr:DUF4232 domain-containing protein [Streptomyces sp. DSM 41699]MDT0466620.1 DUF4232 domain-containing protein [Streptomyces sp. DSM 41699]
MARRTAAVSVVGLTVLLAATACGRGETVSTRPTAGPRETTAPATGPKASPSASSHAKGAAACGTPHLRWKLTRLDGKRHNTPTALLSATNTASRPCAFDGYPDIDVYVGKGPSVSSKPKKSTSVRLALNAGHAVVFPLFYVATPDRHGSCFIPGDNDPRVSVRPPHAAAHDYGAFAQLTDANGRRVPAQVCGTTIQLGSPQLR